MEAPAAGIRFVSGGFVATEPYKIRSLGEYQRSMVRFEKCNDPLILPDLRLVVRLDARRYGSWTPAAGASYPYDPRIAEALLQTARSLLGCGPKIQFCLVHGDEISVLLHPDESANSRRRSQLLSLLSSAGAVHFREHFPCSVAFHSVLSELPSEERLLDYFLWQRRSFVRNVLSQELHGRLRAQGLTPREVDRKLVALALNERIALAEELGYSFAEEPAWKRLGAAVWWEDASKGGKGTGKQAAICRTLPENDEVFLAFLRERIVGPSLVAETPGEPISFEEVCCADALRDAWPVARSPLDGPAADPPKPTSGRTAKLRLGGATPVGRRSKAARKRRAANVTMVGRSNGREKEPE